MKPANISFLKIFIMRYLFWAELFPEIYPLEKILELKV